MAHQSTLEAWLTWMFSPSISAILVTLLVSLSLPVLIHYYLYRKSKAAELPTFLLLGPSGAGKTTLLTRLATGTPSTTYTSQSPQSALCHLPSTTSTSTSRYRSEHDPSAQDAPAILLIDTPGHGKLRHHALSTLSTPPSSLLGLIFVVDSAALSSAAGLTEAAEYLHDVLLLLQRRQAQSKSAKGPGPSYVLVAANKQDVFTSLPAGLVKGKLEAEIARVRGTRSRALVDSGVSGDADGEDEEGGWLGEFGSKDFAFGQMEEHGVEVTVLGGNVKGEEEGEVRVGEWWEWIGEHL